MEVLPELVRLQAKLQQEKVELTKKHEESFKDLELRFQSERTILAKSVETEVQTKLAAEERDVQRALEVAIAHDDPQRRCERHEKKIQELQEELLNIREDLENRTDMVNALNTRHMSTNDELQEAKKLLKRYTSDNIEKSVPISIKRAGELCTEAWVDSFQERYEDSKYGWEYHMSQAVSEWDAKLTSSDFNPFQKIQVGKDEWKEVIDEADPQLVSLCEDYGAEVCASNITDALKEIMTYNPSGRYIVEVPWNYITNKEATMKDIVLQLGELIKQNDSPIKAPAKRRRKREEIHQLD